MTIPEFIQHLRAWQHAKNLVGDFDAADAFGKAAEIIELQQTHISGVDALIKSAREDLRGG